MPALFPKYSIESLEKEIEISKALKENYRVRVDRFVDKTNAEFKKRELPIIMARVTDKSYNNLVYRLRNAERTRTSFLSGLDPVLDRRKHKEHFDFLVSTELQKEGINRRWSSYQHNLDRCTHLRNRLIEIRATYKDPYKKSFAGSLQDV